MYRGEMPTSTASAPPVGRRERKKNAVRASIVTAALDLFERQGVDATTIEEITDSVDLATRTFHRYFATKLDVLFHDSQHLSDLIRGALESRSENEPLLVSLREAFLELASDLTTQRARQLQRQKIIEAHDGLKAMSLRRSEELAALVTHHCAARLQSRPHDLLPQLLGGCAAAAFRAARTRWMTDRRVDLQTEVRRSFEMLADFEQALRGSAR